MEQLASIFQFIGGIVVFTAALLLVVTVIVVIFRLMDGIKKKITEQGTARGRQ